MYTHMFVNLDYLWKATHGTGKHNSIPGIIRKTGKKRESYFLTTNFCTFLHLAPCECINYSKNWIKSVQWFLSRGT